MTVRDRSRAESVSDYWVGAHRRWRQWPLAVKIRAGPALGRFHGRALDLGSWAHKGLIDKNDFGRVPVVASAAATAATVAAAVGPRSVGSPLHWRARDVTVGRSAEWIPPTDATWSLVVVAVAVSSSSIISARITRGRTRTARTRRRVAPVGRLSVRWLARAVQGREARERPSQWRSPLPAEVERSAPSRHSGANLRVGTGGSTSPQYVSQLPYANLVKLGVKFLRLFKLSITSTYSRIFYSVYERNVFYKRQY